MTFQGYTSFYSIIVLESVLLLVISETHSGKAMLLKCVFFLFGLRYYPTIETTYCLEAFMKCCLF